MVTYKKLGLRMKRNSAKNGWVVLDKNGSVVHESQGNKGQVMFSCLTENYLFKGGSWTGRESQSAS